MTQSPFITTYSKEHMLFGMIICSETFSGRIHSIKLPQLSKDFLVITAKDIPGSNCIKVLDQTFPLLAYENIQYKGQPLLALFGPDREAVISKAYEIAIEVLEDRQFQKAPQEQEETAVPEEEKAASEENLETGILPEQLNLPEEPDQQKGQLLHANIFRISGTERNSQHELHIDWGTPDPQPDSVETPQSLSGNMPSSGKIVDQTYMTNSEESSITAPSGAYAEMVEDHLEIHVSSQWLLNVRNNVSEICGISKRKVFVHPTDYHPTEGEKLIHPTVLAALAALATLKTGLPARVLSDQPVLRPETIISKRTALDPDGVPVSEIIDIQIHVGAHPIFADDMLMQTALGVIPFYPLKTLQIHAAAITSQTTPRHLFGDFGYAAGQFAAEAHASHIAATQQVNPASWRLKYMKDAHLLPVEFPKPRYTLIRDLISKTVQNSDFNRKFAVYEMQKKRRKTLSTFLRYARGIGIACGQGINGLDRTTKFETNYSIEVSLEANDRVKINTSLSEVGAVVIWKQIVKEQLGIEEDHIEVLKLNTSEIMDTGPDILGRDVHIVTILIQRCCESIRSQRFKEPLPIVVRRGYKRPAGDDVPLINSSGWGSVVVEVEVDTVSLRPQLKGIWSAFECGRVYYPAMVKKSILSSFHLAMKQSGADDQLSETQVEREVLLIEDSEGLPASVTRLAYGLFQAAYLQAVSQAMNHTVSNIPIGPEQIVAILGDEA